MTKESRGTPAPVVGRTVTGANPPTSDGRMVASDMVPLACLIIVAATAAVYANSLRVPFLFDDETSILTNQSIRNLWSSAVLQPPSSLAETVGGRPLLNLSFAVNYALSGTSVWSYHVVNIALHAASALMIFGIVRRTLLHPGRSGQWAGRATRAALAVGLLWAVHPMQTAAVTYVVQRAELLCGFFYLFTLYAFVRAIDSVRPAGWLALSVASCVFGMAAKEVMVTAPLMVLLYSRTFVAGSFGEAWRRRRAYYLGLVASWVLLAWLLLRTGGRGGSAGFGLSVRWWQYALKQCEAVVHYLRLAIWPSPLVFDYGRQTPPHFADVWPQALLLAGLLVATGYALWRRPSLGFFGAWFFVILAPSSSVVPVADAVFEHRVYLSLAAILTLIVLGLAKLPGRLGWWLAGAAAIGCASLTVARNRDYRSAVSIWADTVEKRPVNARALGNLGAQLVGLNRSPEAVPYLERAVELTPTDSLAEHNLGNALDLAGRRSEAIPHYEAAVRLNPANRNAHLALAITLSDLNRFSEAMPHFQETVRLSPNDAEVHVDYSQALLRAGRIAEGEAELREALRLDPASAKAHANLGNVLLVTHRAAEAVPQLEAALQVAPDNAANRAALGAALALTDRVAEARVQLERALALDPANALAQRTLRLLPPPATH